MPRRLHFFQRFVNLPNEQDPDDAVRRFVERFALLLTEAGTARTPARVFACVLLGRGREPGSRRDHYAVHDDVWTDMYTTRMGLLRRWEQVIAEGVELVGTDRPAGRRLAETREFFAFLQSEVPGMIRRWEEHKAAHGL
jgi:hypothetical protein